MSRVGSQLNTRHPLQRELMFGVVEGTTWLLKIVEMHEHRLDSHDDHLDNLEGS
jgi:hypothetical protein